MSQYSNGVKPAGYQSRWTTGDEYLDGQVLIDNQQTPDYNYEIPVQSNRDLFGSNCPQVQIPQHPMWKAHPYKG